VKLPAIGCAYADSRIAIVEKYWTTTPLALNLKMPLAITARGIPVFTVYE